MLDNSKIKNSDIRICFFGDSFVNGVNDPEYLGWAGRLVKQARVKGYDITYYNLGVRKNTALDIQKRWLSEFEVRKQQNAEHYLVFSFGVNDVNSGSENSAAFFAKELTKYSKLILVGPPALADRALNKKLAELNKELIYSGCNYIDIFTPLLEDKKWQEEILQDDGFHPKEYGYSRITEIVQQSEHWWFK